MRNERERERTKSSEKEKEKGTFSCSYALQIAKWINAKVAQSRLLNKLIGISVLAYANANANAVSVSAFSWRCWRSPNCPQSTGLAGDQLMLMLLQFVRDSNPALYPYPYLSPSLTRPFPLPVYLSPSFSFCLSVPRSGSWLMWLPFECRVIALCKQQQQQ